MKWHYQQAFSCFAWGIHLKSRSGVYKNLGGNFMPIHLEIPHLKKIRVKLLPGLGQKAGVFFNFLSEEWVSPQKIPFLSKWWWGVSPSLKRACLHWQTAYKMEGRETSQSACFFKKNLTTVSAARVKRQLFLRMPFFQNSSRQLLLNIKVTLTGQL